MKGRIYLEDLSIDGKMLGPKIKGSQNVDWANPGKDRASGGMW